MVPFGVLGWDPSARYGVEIGFQVILRNRTPKMRPWGALPADTKKDLEDYFFCTKEIFPGGLNRNREFVLPHVRFADRITAALDFPRDCGSRHSERRASRSVLIKPRTVSRSTTGWPKFRGITTCVLCRGCCRRAVVHRSTTRRRRRRIRARRR